ncbi:Arylsulfatase [Anaerohalosphaera lusitana]|uniref:Arylsulfatase n=1 Tax=Anaerohalosphaera lusitana TaxID=1936003 RepID=A0A1U9NHD9_9BACT|nr:sulfatase-like hydrolase/transferase [Anaerohalosphaera lusitana]AQT67342.1 Arylsulfatase [Anaerohalosphaera lusitana]
MGFSRRDFLKAVGVGAAGVITGGLSGCMAETAKIGGKGGRKPNIIYILADDLGIGDLGCYGQEKIKTPNIDRLAAEGMKFTDHYSGSTVCAPSRCSLMTGRHTGHCYIRGNWEVQPEGQMPLPAEKVTVAEVMKRAGYTTGAFGKWGLGYPGSEGDPINQGFDEFFGYNCQREAHHFYPDHLWHNDKKVILEGNKGDSKQQYSHDLIAEKSLEFVKEHKDEPFFMFVPFTIPHAELAVPEDSLEQYEDKGWSEKVYKGSKHGYGRQEQPRAAYAAMVTRMDSDVGRLMALLKELDIDDDTIVMFSSDNGAHTEGGNDWRFFDSNGPFRGIKRDLYEGGIRVPMIARWPGKIEAGSVSDHISAFWDILPTCAQLAGVDAPPNIDGLSFVPELIGKPQKKHEYLYWEFPVWGGRQAVRMGKWKAVRLNVKKNPEAPIELYNLNKDIGEQNNVADQHLEIVAKMKEIMEKAHTPSEKFKLFKGE